MTTNKDAGGTRELALVVGLALAGVAAALVVVVLPWHASASVGPVVGVVVPAPDGTQR
jgi:hypothetical protein